MTILSLYSTKIEYEQTKESHDSVMVKQSL